MEKRVLRDCGGKVSVHLLSRGSLTPGGQGFERVGRLSGE